MRATKPSSERPMALNMYGPGKLWVFSRSSAEGRLSTRRSLAGGGLVLRLGLCRYYTCRISRRVSGENALDCVPISSSNGQEAQHAGKMDGIGQREQR